MSTAQLVVSLPPHERSSITVPRIMWSVALALLPTTIAGVIFYGIRPLIVTAVAVIAAVVVEHGIARYMFKREQTTITDGSAVVTAMLLAFNVPASLPLWQIALGSAFAIAVGKMAFGGIGNNPFNPALVGRAFLLLSFPVQMTTWPVPGAGRLSMDLSAVTGPTPLGIIKDVGPGGLENIALPSYFDLFIGNIGGCIGEASALAVIIGGLFLVWRGFVPLSVPVSYFAGLAVVTGAAWFVDPGTYMDPLYHILAGGAMLAGWFMVTDMTSSPMALRGRIIFAAAAGIITAVIRLFGGFPEGATYSILIMNALVPVIDRHVKPRRFGKGRKGLVV